MSKGLLLPLPGEAIHLPHVLTLWADLVTVFFRNTAAEIALCITSQAGHPVLIIGFHGASPATLRSVLDADHGRSDNVALADAQWVEDWVDADPGLRVLSDRLRDATLSVAAAVDLFCSTFLGGPHEAERRQRMEP